MIKNLTMNTYEKLLMIIVPTVGLSAIIYFLFLYLPDVQNGHFYDSSRLQGVSSHRAKNNHSLKNTVVSNPNKIISNAQSTYKKDRKAYMSDYIQWSDKESVTFIPQSVKNKRYKHNPSNIQPVVNTKIINYQNNYNQHSKKPIKKPIKKNNKAANARCDYFLEQKEHIETIMRAGYKPRQYNYLEGRRKYWSKKYADNCF